jgi:dephospho-CoA kinase
MAAMPNRSYVVGLTGGIGTGKTRVTELLEKLGAEVVCADRIVHQIQSPGAEALEEIARVFGPEYIQPDGQLDRVKLGGLVFGDPDARKKLNDIIHPRVTRAMAARLEELRGEGVPVIVLDIPLLLEGRVAGRGTGAVLPFDEIVVVYADDETQLERIRDRDGLSREDAAARVRAQMPIEEKRELADTVIDNSGAWDETERQVRELYSRWATDDSTASPRESRD